MLLSQGSGLMLVLWLTLQVYSVTSQDVSLYTLCDAPRSVVNIGINSLPVLIHSPNYTVGNYGNNQRCSLDFVSGSDPLILSLYYSFFQLEPSIYCLSDALCVNGVNFCGNWLRGQIFNYILPAHRAFTITFTTDGSLTYRGFQIRLTSEFARNYEIRLFSTGVGSSESNINYTIVSYYPGYPYSNRCPADPTTTLPTTIARTFVKTTTARPSGGTTTARFSGGTTTARDSIRTTNVPLPTLWWSVPMYTFCDYSRPSVVDIDGRSRGVLIHSPNYVTGGYYRDNQRCSISLRSVGEPLILTLKYNFFQLQFADPCGRDWLCAHGVLYCGEWLVRRTFQYIVPANSLFTLTFNTDSSTVFRGFEIHVSPESIVNQTIKEAFGGYGSNSNRVIYANVTYGPGYFYTDRCTPTSEAEAAIDNAIELLYRAKAMLVGRN